MRVWGSTLGATARTVSRLADTDELRWLVLDGQGRRLSGDERLAALAQHDPEANPAFGDARLDGRPWRTATYAYDGPEGQATIVVAEALTKREHDARRMLLPTTATNLAIGGLMAVVAVLAVGVALAPLHAVGQRVEGHEVQTLRPMRLRNLPGEVRPLVRALNRLMARLRRTVQARQDFIDDTAHQLRTPLAGLQAQMALLDAEPLPPTARRRVQDVGAAVRRLAHTTHQMLALARSADGASAAPEPVSLPALLEQVASQCLDAALAKGVDLGFEPAAATVQGSPWMLRELLANLVDNAIQHGRPGGIVTVRCGHAAGRPLLQVEDDGPGIPAAERARVFNRFVRLGGSAAGGSGLGLAIVKEIAERHGAHVALDEGTDGHGLKATVTFPAAGAA